VIEPLYLDTETYSLVDLKTAGTYRYAENADIMLIQYAIGDGPVVVWDHHDRTPPPDLARYQRETGCQVIAANAMFDRTVMRLGNLRQEIPIKAWRCTMVQAMSHALPGALSDQGKVLGLPQDMQKLADGRKLINRFCKPAPGNHLADRYTRDTHPEEWARFVEYGVQDVIALREIRKRLPVWNWQPADIADWHLDQKINDRGFAVDLELVEAGARAAVTEKEFLGERFAILTGGLRPSQRDKVRDFINAWYDLELTGTAKHIMQPIADDERRPADLREIARIVLASNKTSTAKYATMLEALSADGRFRGGLQFSGARRTRRWAGRVFQPQNLPSRALPPGDMIEAYIHALKAGIHREFFDDLMLYGAAALRGVVISG
jgi:DNA polymerase